MKHYVLFLMLLFGIFKSKAQVTPVYFRGDQVTNNKNAATSYAVYGKLSTENLWVFKRYDLDDNLIQTGSYSDEGLSIPHGKFVFYMDVEAFNTMHATNFKLKGKTRFTSQQGTFVNGKEHGRWLLFYPDGNILNAQDFVDGKLEGEFVTYDKLGRVEIKGSYADGLRDGEWTFEKGAQRAVYEKGVLKTSEYVTNSNKKSKVSLNDNGSPAVSNTKVKLADPNRKYELKLYTALFNQSHDTNYPAKPGQTFISEQGNFVNNLEDGIWLVYYPDGKVMTSRTYLKGKLNGEYITYDANGTIVSKGNYVNDVKHGMWLEETYKQVYYDKGKVKSPPKK